MASAKQQAESAEKQAEQTAQRFRIKQAYSRLFATPDGQIVHKDLQLGFGQPSLAKDPHTMVVAASMRAVIDHINRTIMEGSQ